MIDIGIGYDQQEIDGISITVLPAELPVKRLLGLIQVSHACEDTGKAMIWLVDR
ncbi:MAG TPA: hypothetical protein VF043_03555 [Ktedonobacteraceae bacterium]